MILEPTSKLWRKTLSRLPHDIFHVPEYVSFAASRQEPGDPRAFVFEDGDNCFFLPLIVRSIEEPWISSRGYLDATCPRDYPGPLWFTKTDDDGAFLRQALVLLKDELQAKNVVSVFSRLHPLFEFPPDTLETVGDVVLHHRSVSIDLTEPEHEHWRQTRRDHRRDINRAAREGYVARIDDSWESFETFYRLYQETMERVQAAERWRFDRDYFLALRDALGIRLHLAEVKFDCEVVAGGLFTEESGMVEYLFSTTRGDHLRLSPTKTMINFVRQWAKARGNAVLHLGGSVRDGDALFEFKAGFSNRIHPVRSWRFIADHEAYASLVAERAALAGDARSSGSDLFPAYRQPLFAT